MARVQRLVSLPRDAETCRSSDVVNARIGRIVNTEIGDRGSGGLDDAALYWRGGRTVGSPR
jgi:hypothetical protein